MPIATVTSKGQVTIPRDVREALGLDEGHRVEFRIRDDGVVELIPLNVDITRYFGAIKPEVQGVSVEAMNPGTQDS